MPRAQLLTLTNPLLHISQTGSFLQFLLMSSPLNPDGRAPTIHSDEPFTALQTDGLLLTILIDELSPQHRWTSSYYLRIDEPFTTLQTDGLFLTILIDELSPQHRWTSSYYLRLTSPLLHFRQTGSLLLFTVTSPSLHFKQTGSFL